MLVYIKVQNYIYLLFSLPEYQGICTITNRKGVKCFASFQPPEPAFPEDEEELHKLTSELREALSSWLPSLLTCHHSLGACAQLFKLLSDELPFVKERLEDRNR